MGVHVNVAGVKGPSIVKVISNKPNNRSADSGSYEIAAKPKPQQYEKPSTEKKEKGSPIAEDKERGWSIANILKAKENQNDSQANKRKERNDAYARQREKILKNRVVVDLKKK